MPPAASYDFLQVLLTELAERGAPYRAVASNTNFTGTLPIALPGPASASTRWARFTDSDVVLARADLHSRHLSVDQTSVAEENFDAVLTIPSPVPGVAPFRVPRGWSSVDVTVKGFTFRLFNTHLEAFGGETVRNRQAAQLAGAVQRSPHPTVVVGDINSRPPGCSTSTAAFQTLLDAGLQEVWPAVHRRDPCGGFTSGPEPGAAQRAEPARPPHRRGPVRPVGAQRTPDGGHRRGAARPHAALRHVAVRPRRCRRHAEDTAPLTGATARSDVSCDGQAQ